MRHIISRIAADPPTRRYVLRVRACAAEVPFDDENLAVFVTCGAHTLRTRAIKHRRGDGPALWEGDVQEVELDLPTDLAQVCVARERDYKRNFEHRKCFLGETRAAPRARQKPTAEPTDGQEMKTTARMNPVYCFRWPTAVFVYLVADGDDTKCHHMKPHDITQVPDVFVYLVADAGEGDPASWTNKSPGDEDRAAFARRSALSLAADGFVGARATSPRWTRLVADGAVGKAVTY